MKKFAIFFLTLLVTSRVLAYCDFEYNGIYYDKIGGTEVAVTYKNYGDIVAKDYSGKIVIPSTVTYNGKQYNVTEIGGAAFAYDSTLTSVSIPNSVKIINGDSFSNSGITSIIIPEGATVERSSFANCFNLKSVTIGEDAIIDGMAFYNCVNITSLYLPQKYTIIKPDRAGVPDEWYGIPVLKENLLYIIKDNCCASIGQAKVSENIINITIPETITISSGQTYSITSLDWGMHRFGKELKGITLASTIEEVSFTSFSNCDNLEKIICLSEIPPQMAPYVEGWSIPLDQEEYNHWDAYLYVPCESKEQYKSSEGWQLFRHIMCGTTAVSEISNNEEITVIDNQIFVNDEAPAFVVTVSGQKIANANLKAGVYFVVVDGNSVKVVVR